MAITVTAREANHNFSRLLAEVESGKEFVVTRNGRPIARVIPERAADGTRKLTLEQEAALERIASTSWPLGVRRFDRDSLHDPGERRRESDELQPR